MVLAQDILGLYFKTLVKCPKGGDYSKRPTKPPWESDVTMDFLDTICIGNLAISARHEPPCVEAASSNRTAILSTVTFDNDLS